MRFHFCPSVLRIFYEGLVVVGEIEWDLVYIDWRGLHLKEESAKCLFGH